MVLEALLFLRAAAAVLVLREAMVLVLSLEQEAMVFLRSFRVARPPAPVAVEQAVLLKEQHRVRAVAAAVVRVALLDRAEQAELGTLAAVVVVVDLTSAEAPAALASSSSNTQTSYLSPTPAAA